MGTIPVLTFTQFFLNCKFHFLPCGAYYHKLIVPKMIKQLTSKYTWSLFVWYYEGELCSKFSIIWYLPYSEGVYVMRRIGGSIFQVFGHVLQLL